MKAPDLLLLLSGASAVAADGSTAALPLREGGLLGKAILEGALFPQRRDQREEDGSTVLDARLWNNSSSCDEDGIDNDVRKTGGKEQHQSTRLGNLRRGLFTSDEYTIGSEEAARRNCDENPLCAAISFRRNPSDPERVAFHTHSFVPEILGVLEGKSPSSWKTYVSEKPFVFQPGRAVVAPRDVLKFEAPSSLSLTEAMDFCREHEECVAFTFPTHSSRLTGFENITFARSLTSLKNDDSDEWRTYVANDLRKSSRVVDPSTLPFDEDFDERPFRSCCRRASRDPRTGFPAEGFPDLADVAAVDDLPRISCDISKEDFFEKYEKTRTPVMLVGCDEQWPAKERWTREALVPRIDNGTTWRSEVIATGSMDDHSWSDIVDDITAQNQFYIFDNLDHSHGASIERDYATPPQFDGTDLYQSGYPKNYGSRRWFCVGTKGTGTDPHMDPVTTDAWNSVVHGHKWWLLYPPVMKDEEVVECDEECSVEDPKPLDWYISVGINARRTALGRDGATPMHVLQKPGETIYVPNGIVHSVMNMDDTAAITANYGSPGNLQLVWKDVLDSDDDKFYKRMYYTVLDAEQRREVREGKYWPPEDWFSGNEAEEDDEEEEEEEENDEEEEEEEEEENDEEENEIKTRVMARVREMQMRRRQQQGPPPQENSMGSE